MWVLTLINVVPSLVMLELQQIHCRDITKYAEAMFWIVQSAAMLGAMIGPGLWCGSRMANKGKFGFALDMVRLSIWLFFEEILSNNLFSSDPRYGCAKNIAENMRNGSITKRHLLDHLTKMSIYSSADPIICFLWSQNNIKPPSHPNQILQSRPPLPKSPHSHLQHARSAHPPSIATRFRS